MTSSAITIAARALARHLPRPALLHYDGSDLQYIVALDKRTGKTVWKTEGSIDFKDLGPDGKPEAEGDMRKAFSTPQIIKVDGAPLLISMGAKATYA